MTKVMYSKPSLIVGGGNPKVGTAGSTDPVVLPTVAREELVGHSFSCAIEEA